MKKVPVMQNKATYSFLHEYLCPITTGKLYEAALMDIFPLANLTKSTKRKYSIAKG